MPSANDNFANATDLGSIGLGSYPQATIDPTSNTSETGEPSSSSSSLRSAWWKFTPTTNCAVAVTASAACTVRIYIGSAVNALTTVDGQQNSTSQSNGATSYPVAVTAGTTYYVQIGNTAFNATTQTVTVALGTPGVNNDFANATDLGTLALGETAATAVDTTFNTVQASEPGGNGSQIRSAWWKFTPTADGTIRVKANTGTFSYSLFTGTVLTSLTGVKTGVAGTGSAYVANPGGTPVTAGTTYYVQLGSTANAATVLTLDLGTRPANDDYANATDLTTDIADGSATATFDNTYATSQTSEPGSAVRTLWFKFTAPSTGRAELQLLAGSIATGTTVRWFTGGTFPSLTAGSVDTSVPAGWYADTSQPVTAGSTYWLQIGNATAFGASSMTITIGTGPANDDFANAVELDVTTLGTTLTTPAPLFASTQSGEPNVGGRSLWWKYQPLSGGTLTVKQATGSGSSLLIATGSAFPLTTVLAASTTTSTRTVSVTGGTTYWVLIGDGGFQPAASTFTFTGPGKTLGVARSTTVARPVVPTLYVPPPANDNFANALLVDVATIGGTWTSPTIDARGATTESGEPTGAMGVDQSRRSTWYKYLPVMSGTVTVDTILSTPLAGDPCDTLLGFWRGTTLGGLTELASDDDGGDTERPLASKLSVAVTAGETYYAQVGILSPSDGSGVVVRFAGPTTVVPPPLTPGTTDTGNRVGGRVRAGLGVATWEPPVVAPPSSSAPVLAQDVAHAFGAVTMLHGAQPSYAVTSASKPRQRDRILVGGVDVTYFRGIPTPLPSYQLVMPLLYGPATLTFPQIAGTFERVGTGHLRWLRKGAPVVVQRVNAETGVVEATDYKGFVVAFNLDGKNLSVEVGGQASGRAALINKQPPLWHAVRDAGAMAYDAIRELRLRFEPRLGPNTGIELANWGGLSWLDYINELCAKAQDRDGTQWTLLPDSTGAYRFRRKDETTIDATVYLDDAWSVASIRRDIAEEPNRVFATGVNPQGRRVRGAVFPGLNQGERPPYPFTDHGHTFGQGTVDADTDTGDGIAVMVNRLWVTRYLDREDTPGGYDKDAKQAVKALQEDAGLTADGVMTFATWRALFDLSATGYSLRGSHIEPMAQRTKVKQWLRTSSGAKLARNPDYDPSVIPVDLNVDLGVGFKANQIKEWARAELSTEDNWVGTISLNTGAVIDGTHNPGDALDSTRVRRARSLVPGMNVWCPQFMGGTRFHVSAVSVDADGKVSLTVDTRARDTMKVWEVIARNRETRANPARAWIAQHRSSTMENDGVAEWDAVGGVIEDVKCLAGKWTVIPIAAGQEGTVRSLRIRTDDPAEYVVALFGREVKPKWLTGLVPNPLASPSHYTTTDPVRDDEGNIEHNEDGTDKTETVRHSREDNSRRWESEKVRKRLDARLLLYAAGTDKQPCGYFPGRKTDDNGKRTHDRLTGRHEDDAGVSYHTFAEPVLYMAIFVDRLTTVRGGRILWNQLETSS